MPHLIRILKAIFLAGRALTAKKVEYTRKVNPEQDLIVQPIEIPPPQEKSSSNGFFIGAPIIDDYAEFFNIYCVEFANGILEERCELCIPYPSESTIKAVGATRELQALLQFLEKKNIKEWLFFVFKFRNYFIIAANELDSHTQFWYYCTQLELPEDIFYPAITWITLSKEKKNKKKENELDCSHKYKGGN